jgi:hypothetical protein
MAASIGEFRFIERPQPALEPAKGLCAFKQAVIPSNARDLGFCLCRPYSGRGKHQDPSLRSGRQPVTASKGQPITLRFRSVEIVLTKTRSWLKMLRMAKKTGMSDSSLWVIAIMLLAIAAWTFLKK